MEVYEKGHGISAGCGEEVEESLYWTPLPDPIWNAVREFVAPLFRDGDHIQSALFFPDYSKPLCSAECVKRYYEKVAVSSLARGG